MRIEPGYYKVEIKEGYFRSRYHYLRVFVKNQKKYLQLDHGIPEPAENSEENFIQSYVLVKRITKPIEVINPRVTVRWRDEDGHEFEMAARNSHLLDRIFELFPRLKKAFFIRSED